MKMRRSPQSMTAACVLDGEYRMSKLALFFKIHPAVDYLGIFIKIIQSCNKRMIIRNFTYILVNYTFLHLNFMNNSISLVFNTKI